MRYRARGRVDRFCRVRNERPLSLGAARERVSFHEARIGATVHLARMVITRSV